MLLARLIAVASVAALLGLDLALRYSLVRKKQPLRSMDDWPSSYPPPVVALLAALSMSLIGWPALLLLVTAALAAVDTFQTNVNPSPDKDVAKFNAVQRGFSGLLAGAFFGFELIVSALLLRGVFDATVSYFSGG